MARSPHQGGTAPSGWLWVYPLRDFGLWTMAFGLCSAELLFHRRPSPSRILPQSSWFKSYQFLRNGLWPSPPSKWCFANVLEEDRNTQEERSALC